MKPTIALMAVCVAAGVTAAALLHPGTANPAHPNATPTLAPATNAKPGPRLGPSPLTASQVDSTATRWVTAMWTRPTGTGPLDWLARVADITSPDLSAELRTARPTFDDQSTISVTVNVDAVYPSAVDPDTVTVTCDAHRTTTTGPIDQPCATTLTVQPGPGGNLVITAVG